MEPRAGLERPKGALLLTAGHFGRRPLAGAFAQGKPGRYIRRKPSTISAMSGGSLASKHIISPVAG